MSDVSLPQATNRIEILYYKYEFIIHGYAGKMFNVDQLGMEREDVAQELRVKLYTSILAYLKAWKAYRTTGKRKPVPMYYYLCGCLKNHLNDMIRKVKYSEEIFESNRNLESNYDIGTYDPTVSQIDLGPDKVAQINGVDLMQGLHGTDLAIWVMFLKGYAPAKIQNLLRSRLQKADLGQHYVTEVITFQRKRLQKHRDALTLESTSTYRVRQLVEE